MELNAITMSIIESSNKHTFISHGVLLLPCFLFALTGFVEENLKKISGRKKKKLNGFFLTRKNRIVVCIKLNTISFAFVNKQTYYFIGLQQRKIS